MILSKIDDRVLITRLKKAVYNSWHEPKDINIFPGPLPVSLERKDYDKLKGYYISAKTDGVRYLLLGYDKRVFLIDRNYTFQEITDVALFNENVYKHDKNVDFLVDGELISIMHDEKLKYSYVMHDLITYTALETSETHLGSKNFTERYNAAKILVGNVIDYENFHVSLKPFYPLNEIERLVTEMKENRHSNDGLIFVPGNKPIGTQTQFNLYKWKEIHTFDFVIKVEESKYCFYVSGYVGSGLTLFADLEIGCKEGQEFKACLEKNCKDFVSGSIVECLSNSKATMYYPKMVRRDKQFPNSLKNVERTIVNVKEGITIEELIKAFGT